MNITENNVSYQWKWVKVTNSSDKTGLPDVCHEYSIEYYLNNIYCLCWWMISTSRVNKSLFLALTLIINVTFYCQKNIMFILHQHHQPDVGFNSKLLCMFDKQFQWIFHSKGSFVDLLLFSVGFFFGCQKELATEAHVTTTNFYVWSWTSPQTNINFFFWQFSFWKYRKLNIFHAKCNFFHITNSTYHDWLRHQSLLSFFF